MPRDLRKVKREIVKKRNLKNNSRVNLNKNRGVLPSAQGLWAATTVTQRLTLQTDYFWRCSRGYKNISEAIFSVLISDWVFE